MGLGFLGQGRGMNPAQDNGYPSSPISARNMVGPQCGLGKNGDADEIDVFEIFVRIDRGEEIVGIDDLNIGRREACKDGKGQIGDRGILLHGGRDQLDLHEKILTTHRRIVKDS